MPEKVGESGLSGIGDDEAAALAAVDEAAAARTLLELISVPSVTGSAAESELQHRLAERLERLGLDVDLWPLDLPALRTHPGFPGTEAPREEAWGLVGHGGRRRRARADPPGPCRCRTARRSGRPGTAIRSCRG